MNCYGKFYKKIEKCSSCIYTKECKESILPVNPIKSSSSIAEAEFKHEAEADADILRELSLVMGDCMKLLIGTGNLELVYRFLGIFKDLYQNSQKMHEIVLDKMANSLDSYTEIGKRHDLSKQMVAWHLSNAKKLFPELNKAIVVNKKYYNKEKYYQKEAI